MAAPQRYVTTPAGTRTGVALLTGVVLAAVTAAVIGADAALPAAVAYTVLTTVAVHRHVITGAVPTTVLGGTLVVLLVLSTAAALAADDVASLRNSLVGAVVAVGAVAGVQSVATSSIVTSDSGYAGLAGLVLGWSGLGRVGAGLIVGFVLGAVTAGPVTRARGAAAASFGFGPALAAGAWVALLWGGEITTWFGR